MSLASDLIERCEKETGQRVDDPNGNAMTMLFGALARQLNEGQTNLTGRDDYAIGALVQHQMSPEGKQQKQSEEVLRQALLSGLSPDNVRNLF
jgi:hypothetical protein